MSPSAAGQLCLSNEAFYDALVGGSWCLGTIVSGKRRSGRYLWIDQGLICWRALGTGHSPPPHSWWSPGSLKSQPVHRKKPYSEACQWVSSPTWNCFKNKQNKKLCWILWVSMIHWEIDVYHILIHFRSLGLRTLLQGNGCVCVTLTGQGVARYITTLRVTGWPSTLPMMCEESAHLRKK